MDVKEAVSKAKKELAEILVAEKPEDIRLEEAILDDANNWVVTLSYKRQDTQSPDNTRNLIALSHHIQRAYKIVTMKKSTGEIISIRIRELS